MPGISSGIFGFPKTLCAQVMLNAVREWLSAHAHSTVKEVNACNIDAQTAQIFGREAEVLFGKQQSS